MMNSQNIKLYTLVGVIRTGDTITDYAVVDTANTNLRLTKSRVCQLAASGHIANAGYENGELAGLDGVDLNTLPIVKDKPENAQIDTEIVQGFHNIPLTVTQIEAKLKEAGITKHRKQMQQLDKFCSLPSKKVLALYGLRRTGKSVLMLGKADTLIQEGKKVLFFELHKGSNQKALLDDLQLAYSQGYQYIFIDEITYVSGFMDWANFLDSHLPNVHVVISGTDSYGLYLANDTTLYDRCILVHTTRITYKEYCDLYPNTSIIKFIRDGGILTKDGDIESWQKYVDTAIVDNIVNTLQQMSGSRYKALGSFSSQEQRSLILYALAGFKLDFMRLKEVYDLSEVSLARSNLAQRNEKRVILDDSYVADIKAWARVMLGVEKIAGDVELALNELEQVMLDLGVIATFPVSIETPRGILNRTEYVITVPGLRYHQTIVAASCIFDIENPNASAEDRNNFIQGMLEVSEGFLLEAVIYSDLCSIFPEAVFKLEQIRRTASGEIDLLVTGSGGTHLYEVKRSSEQVDAQARNLRSLDFDALVEKLGYTAISKNVLYLGKTTDVMDGVRWINIEEFLLNTGKFLPHGGEVGVARRN